MINIFIALLALIAAGLIFRTNARKHEINEKTKFGFLVPHKKPAQENLEPEATPTVNAANLDYTEINRSWRIAEELGRRGGLSLSHESVQRILERRAMPVYEGARRKGRVRYERDEPNDLWHMDLKGPFYIRGVGRFYFVGLIDDYSRFVLRATLISAKEQELVLSVVRAAVEHWQRPREMMTDNGTEFTNRREDDSSPLEGYLRQQGVRYLRTGVAQPETNGKIERFWETLIAELLETQFFCSLEEAQAALDRFVTEYNYHRLHSALDYNTPASRYLGCSGYDTGFAGVHALSGLDQYLDEVRQAVQAGR